MKKINILDMSTFSKIAAGEVVERPASIIKETVENSLDAGAKHITVEITSGGIRKIRVSDDGSGIYYDDLESAFLPHATSKIATIEDLSKIGTLGFRGEALSSIASVSKVTLLSKTADSSMGGEIKIEGGQIKSIKNIGCPNGTYITIEDIFYCVPARQKFLKKPKLEESECTNIMLRLILSNPSVSFKYIVDDKIIFNTFGTNLKDNIYTIYGKEFVDNLVEVDHTNELLNIHIYGYITRPTFTRANRTYQSLFINHRYVQNQVVSTAVYKAYEPFLMKGGFPVFILNLDFPEGAIDVNVHPNKLDVKFENSNQIFAFVNGVISEVLYNLNHTKTISTYEKVEENKESKSETFKVNQSKLVKIDSSEGSNYSPKKAEDSTPYDASLLKAVSHFTSNDDDKKFELHNDEEKNAIANTILNNYAKVEKSQDLGQNSLKQDTMRELALEYKIVGTLFNTYILLEQEDDMLVIDQHAAHERLLYDKFKANFEKSETLSCDLLVPYILNVNSSEFAFLIDNIENFRSLGFELDEFGNNCIKVSSVPNMLRDIDYVDFFNNVLRDTDNLDVKKSDIMKDYIAKKACRSAVKANDILSDSEIKTLLKMLSNSSQVLLCPHGRPIVVKVSKKEIEKWFKRIV